MDLSNLQLKVGLFGIGLDTYWPQFPGLRERLEGYTGRIVAKLASSQVQIVNLGLIDTPEKSVAAGHEFRKADVDLILSTCRRMRSRRRSCPQYGGRKFR